MSSIYRPDLPKHAGFAHPEYWGHSPGDGDAIANHIMPEPTRLDGLAWCGRMALYRLGGLATRPPADTLKPGDPFNADDFSPGSIFIFDTETLILHATAQLVRELRTIPDPAVYTPKHRGDTATAIQITRGADYYHAATRAALRIDNNTHKVVGPAQLFIPTREGWTTDIYLRLFPTSFTVGSVMHSYDKKYGEDTMERINRVDVLSPARTQHRR